MHERRPRRALGVGRRSAEGDGSWAVFGVFYIFTIITKCTRQIVIFKMPHLAAARSPQLAVPPASSAIGTGSSAPRLRASSARRRPLPALRAPPARFVRRRPQLAADSSPQLAAPSASSALGTGSSAPHLRAHSAGARSRPSPRGGAPAAPVPVARALPCSRSAEPEEELWSRPPRPIL